ncbi:hypothetical protein JCM3766R1_003259 [Sporobolomyces carnicolor]
MTPELPSGISDKAARYYDLLSFDPTSPRHDDSTARLSQLRQLILLEGLPDGDEGSVLRSRVWKLLLHLHHLPPSHVERGIHPLLDPETYRDLVSRDPSPMFTKIRNDTFRTLATDQEFLNKVGEEKLVRCLEAFVWRQIDAGHSELPQYVQGLNVLCAPFLYSLSSSQMEAWACFTSFVENQAPRYIRPTLVGVHDGLLLVDECLISLDPTLHSHLSRYNLSAELYAFPSILTFCVATPPLKEALELWDFLLSFGCGLNVLCVVAQLWMMRRELLESKTPMKLLRTFPPLKSKEIIPLVVQFLGDLSPELYAQVVRHPWDDNWKSEGMSS